jgi:hypothetical protein
MLLCFQKHNNIAVMKGCARHPLNAYYWEYGIPT